MTATRSRPRPGLPAVPESAGDGSDPRSDDAGVVIVWTALAIVALVLIGSLAVDIGVFYARANQAQRAADAAALAGAAFLPDDPESAIAQARITLLKNEFDVNDPTISAEIGPHPDDDRILRVELTDWKVETYLGALITDSIEITRVGLAEHSEPISMGSPYNYMGTGDLPAPAGFEDQGFWLAVNHWCSSTEDGDLFYSYYRGGRRQGDLSYGSCSGTGTNPEHGWYGHVYKVEVPEGLAAPITLEAYDPAYWPLDRPCLPPDCDVAVTDPVTFRAATDADGVPINRSLDPLLITGKPNLSRTSFTIRKPDVNGTPGNPEDDPWHDYTWFNGGAAGAGTLAEWQTVEPYFRQWAPITTINPGDPAGTYHVWVKQDGFNGISESYRPSANAYALRARVGDTTHCDSRVTPGCPQVSGTESLSMLVDSSGSVARLNLAQIPESARGKVVQVTLFDPGEGGQSIKFFNPDAPATPVQFDWRESTMLEDNPLYDGEDNVSLLDVSGCGPGFEQPAPADRRVSDCRFNDRAIEIFIDVPLEYTAANGGWWSIEYDFGAGNPDLEAAGRVTDRSTWNVLVLGDPVSLANE